MRDSKNFSEQPMSLEQLMMSTPLQDSKTSLKQLIMSAPEGSRVKKVVELVEQNPSELHRQKLFDLVMKFFDKIVMTESSNRYNYLTGQYGTDEAYILKSIIILAKTFPKQRPELFKKLMERFNDIVLNDETTNIFLTFIAFAKAFPKQRPMVVNKLTEFLSSKPDVPLLSPESLELVEAFPEINKNNEWVTKTIKRFGDTVKRQPIEIILQRVESLAKAFPKQRPELFEKLMERFEDIVTAGCHDHRPIDVFLSSLTLSL